MIRLLDLREPADLAGAVAALAAGRLSLESPWTLVPPGLAGAAWRDRLQQLGPPLETVGAAEVLGPALRGMWPGGARPGGEAATGPAGKAAASDILLAYCRGLAAASGAGEAAAGALAGALRASTAEAWQRYAELGVDLKDPVVVLAGGPWLLAAVLLAAMGRRPLLLAASPVAATEWLASVRPRSCAVVAEPAQLTAGYISRLVRATAALPATTAVAPTSTATAAVDGPTSGGGPEAAAGSAATAAVDDPAGTQAAGAAMPLEIDLGLIVGRTPEVALELVLKAHLYPQLPPAGRSCLMMLPSTLESKDGDGKDPAVFNWAESRLEAFRPLIHEGDILDQFSIMTHGREDNVWCKDTLICGRSPEGTAEPPGTVSMGVPTCVHLGRCYRPERHQLDAATIRARVIYVNSCLTFKFSHSSTSLAYSVGMRLLDGWGAAVVANPTMVDGRVYQNLLLHHLLRRGTRVGEAVRLVNNATVHTGTDPAMLLLVGDPCFALPPAAEPVTPETIGLPEPQCPITLAIPAGADFVEARIPGPAGLKPRTPGLVVLPPGETKRRLFYTLAPDPAQAALRLFLMAILPLPEPVEVTLTSDDPLVQAAAQTARFERAAAHRELLGIRPDALEGVASQHRHAMRSLLKLAGEHRYDLLAADQLCRTLARLVEFHRRSRDLTMEWLCAQTEARAFQFYEEYKVFFTSDLFDLEPGAVCRYCGQELIGIKLTSCVDPAVVRLVRLCPGCGVIAEGPEGRALDAWLEGPDKAQSSGEGEQRLVVVNRGSRAVEAMAAVRLLDSQKWGITIQPGSAALRLEPGARTSLPFTFTFPRNIETPYCWLRGYLLTEDDCLSTCGRTLFILPQPPAGREPHEPEVCG